MEGVIRTRVGYAGGDKEHPTYRSMGDHTETVQIDFDPSIISYEELLTIFWKSHKPSSNTWSRQYMNVIFYHDDAQKERAIVSKKEIEHSTSRPVKTRILPVKSFTMAEDYHQKFNLKHKGPLKHAFATIYPDHQDLVHSTAAARLNGYAGGYGDQAQLAREIDSYGLSSQSRQALEKIVGR